MINTFLNNYFGFNKQQCNGLVVLVCISFLLLVIRLTYPSFIKPADIVIKNLPLTERRLDSNYRATHAAYRHAYKEQTPGHLFAFDPNTVSYDQLVSLGFREKTATTFLKYRNKGFVFKEKKDLQKIYGVSDKFYATLEPFIVVENKKSAGKQEADLLPGKSKKNEDFTAKQPAQKTIELNSCDSSALVALSGIGPSYAKRILKYRSILGGYVAVEQLKEVYGLPEDVFEKIKPFVTINPLLVKKINLNKDDFKAVNKHPYLSYELTKVIFDWRRKTTITPINLKDILNDELLYKKLLPYVEF